MGKTSILLLRPFGMRLQHALLWRRLGLYRMCVCPGACAWRPPTCELTADTLCGWAGQGGSNWSDWDTWVTNCSTAYVGGNNAGFPRTLPDELDIPEWLKLDWSQSRWNESLSYSYAIANDDDETGSGGAGGRGGKHVGAIVGGIIGAVVALVLLALLARFLFVRRKRRRQERSGTQAKGDEFFAAPAAPHHHDVPKERRSREYDDSILDRMQARAMQQHRQQQRERAKTSRGAYPTIGEQQPESGAPAMQHNPFMQPSHDVHRPAPRYASYEHAAPGLPPPSSSGALDPPVVSAPVSAAPPTSQLWRQHSEPVDFYANLHTASAPAPAAAILSSSSSPSAAPALGRGPSGRHHHHHQSTHPPAAYASGSTPPSSLGLYPSYVNQHV